MSERTDLEAIIYFRGLALEAGPARGRKTLYVAAPRPLEEVRRFVGDADHVVLGARHPDAPRAGPVAPDAPELARLVSGLLDDGLWVSLRMRARDHEAMARRLGGLWARSRFSPVIVVDLPAELANANHVVVLDQTARGGGAWSVPLGDLERSRAWTPCCAAGRLEVLARARDLA